MVKSAGDGKMLCIKQEKHTERTGTPLTHDRLEVARYARDVHKVRDNPARYRCAAAANIRNQTENKSIYMQALSEHVS